MRNHLIALSLITVLGIGQAAAAEVQVSFQEPEKFTDIRPTNDTRSRYQQRVQTAFEKMFNDMAAQMPEGYQWQVTITDIDLAGDVDYFAGNGGQALRIIKDVHSPAVRFSHVLRDQRGEEVLSGEERLRDMGFLQRISRPSARPEFEYERVMLNDWFTKNVQPAVTQHAAVTPKTAQ